MGELVKWLRWGLRPFGYDVRKRPTYNLLPFLPFEEFSELRAVTDVFDKEPATPLHPEDDISKLKIYLRTCMKAGRNLDAVHEISGARKDETILRCLHSLVKSVDHAIEKSAPQDIEVTILDDHSDAEYLSKIKRIASLLNCPWTIKTTSEAGQGASLIEQFKMARFDNSLCYFCEDDYLHELTAIEEMCEFYKRIYQLTGSHLVIHPQESESLYGSYYPSYILLSGRRHWRTMSHATHSFFTHGKVVDKFWDYFENTKYVGNMKKRRLASESKTTNKLFNYIPGFAPLPALAGHFQKQGTLPPFFEWKRLWGENGITF